MRTTRKQNQEAAEQIARLIRQEKPLHQPSASGEAAVGGYPPPNNTGPIAKAFVLVGIGLAALYALRRYQRR